VTAIDRAVRDDALRSQILDIVAPTCLTMRRIAERLIATSARPGRIAQVPQAVLRIMSVLAKPVAPSFARQAQAAVVMNTTDMTATPARSELAGVYQSATTLGQLVRASASPATMRRAGNPAAGPG
jgi:hypothetical protein